MVKASIIVVIALYALGTLATITIVVLSWVLWDKRFKSKNYEVVVPEGFVKTDEVFIDPTTERRVTVYFNATTGERFYKDDSQKRS